MVLGGKRGIGDLGEMLEGGRGARGFGGGWTDDLGEGSGDWECRVLWIAVSDDSEQDNSNRPWERASTSLR